MWKGLWPSVGGYSQSQQAYSRKAGGVTNWSLQSPADAFCWTNPAGNRAQGRPYRLYRSVSWDSRAQKSGGANGDM